MLLVGRIGKPHGIRGDVFVSFTTDRDERREVGAVLVARGIAGRSSEDVELTIDTCRAQADRHIVHFAGYDDRNAAERLVNASLYAEAIDDPDALWVHELIGSSVVMRDGARVGECVSVLDNPAHAILEIDNGVLIPVPFVVEFRDGVVVIDPPPGLLDIADSNSDADSDSNSDAESSDSSE